MFPVGEYEHRAEAARKAVLEFNRRYMARGGVIGIVVTALLIVIGWGLLVAERAALPFVAIGAVSTVVAVWQGVDALKNGGVQEAADGITNRRVFGRLHWPWDDIDSFTSARSRVFVVLGDKRVAPLIGIAQGYRNTWKGGETRDIVAVLNERLELWRAHQAGR
jgi:hypothetical protein